MESYPGRFPFSETTPALSLSSPPSSLFSGSVSSSPPPISGDSGHHRACHRSPEERLLPPSTPAALVFHDLAGKPRIEAKTTPAAV
ncbi:hypothetical protein RchiOBHm_Chr2g0127941 [Rosa chinensis]|uniref:Uncharacterized protein n=1 Tax=Rosa chinensis TaxID=74649 RepID=A0A2P6RU64_ROSCH|nr:hypothetical protein RchiOBHm_Chr2g0127931 [Rosa chinensis]PRQ49976.1 hypothetical protein RchiOBHm_Chr2g0127941 [Rosa chinensis]